MILEPENAPTIGPYALEDAITVQKSVVKDGDRGLFGRNELPVNINKIHNASRPWTIAKDKCILIADPRNPLLFIDQESMGLLWKEGRMMPTLHGVLSYG
jgi:hypothetical protein